MARVENKILIGDWMEQWRNITLGSVQTCVTSVPYWGLRDYGTTPTWWDEHDEGCNFHDPDEDGFCSCGAWYGVYGLEPTPELYVKHTIDVFNHVKSLLTEDGTLWLNIGDTHWGGKGRSGEESVDSALDREQRGKSYKHSVRKVNQDIRPQDRNHEFIKPKDLVGIPWMVAFALRDQGGWYLRSDIIWNKKNPMPESVKDRPTRTHEHIFLFSKSKHYYYDSEAIREPASPTSHARVSQSTMNRIKAEREQGKSTTDNDIQINHKQGTRAEGAKSNDNYHKAMVLQTETRNKRDVWTVETNQVGNVTHTASFPPKLITPCILAGSREGDLVLDPFGGTGTTAEVALNYGRKFVICEISEDYVEKELRPKIRRALSKPKLLY